MTTRQPRMGQEVVIDELVDVEGYRLPELSNIGNVRYEMIQPSDPATRILNAANELNYTLYKKDWVARSSGDIGGYFEFSLDQIDSAGAVAAIGVEPWAIFSELDLQINGESVLPNMSQQWAAIYTSWLARQNVSWLGSHGDQMNMTQLANGTLVHPLYSRPSIGATAGANQASDAVRFVVPLPPLGPLNNPFHALPVGHLDRVTLRCVLNNGTTFASTLVAGANIAATTSLRLSNCNLVLPYFSVDPRTDAAISKRLSEAMYDPTRAVVLDSLTTSILTQDLLDNTGEQNFTFMPNRQFGESLEVVCRPSAPVAANSWRASGSVRTGISSYWFSLDGNPTSVRPIDTATHTPYVRFLDHVSALNKIAKEPYKIDTAVFERMTQGDSGVAGAANALSYFNAVSPLTVPGSEGLDASRDLNAVQLLLTKTATANVTMQCRLIFMVHGRTRLLLTKNTVAVKH